MNFDDLHDPEPPRPGMDTLASVAGRARQLRRRRIALLATGGALAVAIVAVPLALALTGDDAGQRIVPATVPPVPETTVAVPPTTTSPVTTTAIPALPSDVVAIRADGDAVRIGTDGSQAVLYDGADPRVQPEEGELTIVDSVLVTPDGRTFVSTCCEPIVGSWFDVDAPEQVGGYGHGLALSPDGTKIVTAGASMATITDTAGQTLTQMDSADYTDVYTQVEQAMWLDDDLPDEEHLVLLLFQEGDFSLARTAADSIGSLLGATDISTATDPNAPWPQLAGVDSDGSILVFQGVGEAAIASTLQAYDGVSLERLDDVPLPAEATYAWVQDGVLTWIGADGALHVDEAVVPGDFRWARPVR